MSEYPLLEYPLSQYLCRNTLLEYPLSEYLCRITFVGIPPVGIRLSETVDFLQKIKETCVFHETYANSTSKWQAFRILVKYQTILRETQLLENVMNDFVKHVHIFLRFDD